MMVFNDDIRYILAKLIGGYTHKSIWRTDRKYRYVLIGLVQLIIILHDETKERNKTGIFCRISGTIYATNGLLNLYTY